MIKYYRVLFLLVFALASCVTQKNKILFFPDPAQDNQQEQNGLFEYRQVIESQNGPGESGIPLWVRAFLDGGVREIESLDAYQDKYVFVGKNRGDNFNVLRQWAEGFTVTQDLPRLIAQRAERRLIAAAALYPDDEYGEYFEKLIKKLSDEEYPGAVKEQTFWLKQKIKVPREEDAIIEDELPQEDIYFERYEFLVLNSINAETLQTYIQKIMADIKTSAAPTREQAAAIQKIQNTFFEAF